MQQSIIENRLHDETCLMLNKLKEDLVQHLNKMENVLYNQFLDEQDLLLVQKSINRLKKFFTTNFNIIIPQNQWTLQDDKYVEGFLSNKPEFEIFDIAYHQLRETREQILSSARATQYQKLPTDTKTKEFEQISNTYYYGYKNKRRYCGRGVYISDTTFLYGYFLNGDLSQGIGIELIDGQIKVQIYGKQRKDIFCQTITQYNQNYIDKYINSQIKNKVLLAKYNKYKLTLNSMTQDYLKSIECSLETHFDYLYYGGYNVSYGQREGKGIQFNNYMIKAGFWIDGILQKGFRLICLSNQCMCDEPHISNSLDDMEPYAYALEIKDRINAGQINFKQIFAREEDLSNILYYTLKGDYSIYRTFKAKISEYFHLEAKEQIQIDDQLEFTVLMDYEYYKYIYIGQVNKFNHNKHGRGILLINKQIFLNGYFNHDTFIWGMYIIYDKCEINQFNISVNRLIEKIFYQLEQQKNQYPDDDDEYFQQQQ